MLFINLYNKIPSLDVLIDAMIILTPLYIKKHTGNNSCILNYKSECPHRYKTAIIKIC